MVVPGSAPNHLNFERLSALKVVTRHSLHAKNNLDEITVCCDAFQVKLAGTEPDVQDAFTLVCEEYKP